MSAPLDETIRVYPHAHLDPGRPAQSLPAAVSPARVVARLAHRSARPPRPQASPTRPARVAESLTSSLAPFPQTLTETPSGNGAGPPAPLVQQVDPVQLSTGVARSLRVYDQFPRMPELLRAQRRTEVVDVDICVSKTGTVRDVRLRGASPLLGRVLREALLTWRYRPFIQQDTPTAFCHSQRLTYQP